MSEDSRETQRKFREAIEELTNVISKLKNENKISYKITDPRKWDGD